MKFEIKHRLSGAILFSLETKSLKLCVEAAVKSGADLSGADLNGAYLRDADLRNAYLRGAYLSGADLSDADAVIPAGFPNGWECFGWLPTDENAKTADERGEECAANVLNIRVGCRNKTLAEGRAYWAGKPNRAEVLAALDYIEAVAKLRGWHVEN